MRSLFLVCTIGILAGCNSTTRVGYHDAKQFKNDAYRACLKFDQSPHYRVVEYDTDSAVIECLPPYQDKGKNPRQNWWE